MNYHSGQSWHCLLTENISVILMIEMSHKRLTRVKHIGTTFSTLRKNYLSASIMQYLNKII